MSYPILLRSLWFESVLLTWAALGPVHSAEPASPADELWQQAEVRIEQRRRADVLVTVLDSAGQPIPGAIVRLEQTRHAFLFGCNIFLWGRVGDEPREAEYRRRFADVFNYATLPFYWPAYEPQRGRPDHARTEQIARWCQAHNILCKGHPLCWNYAEPRWLPLDLSHIRDLQLARIDDCVTRFRGLIDRWDVVNEATHYDRDEFKKRAPKHTAMWAQVGQVDLPRLCFRRARQANPQATLLINDYRTDPAYEQLIEQLVDETGRKLYDVIGIQSHLHGGTWSNQRLWEVCERFARFGVPLHFTETTILSGRRGWELARSGEAWASTPEGEAEQARAVERFYTLLYSHPAVAAITWWDFSDLHAWQRAPAGFLRADMTPKPAYDVLHKLIKEKWWTNAAANTDARGTAKFRGTLGDYRIVVQVPGNAETVQTGSVLAEKVNEFLVRAHH